MSGHGSTEQSQCVQAIITIPRTKGMENIAVEEGESDLDYIVEPRGIVDNLIHLLPLVCVSDGQGSTSKRVRYLNDLAKVIKSVGHVIEPNYPVERVIECVRLSLASSIKEVRAGALRVLRYLLTSKDAFAVMLKHRIDLFVARSLDVPTDREIERLQAMRFVRQAISVAPDIFPRSLATPMVSILLFEEEPQDNLTWSCMATLCELALHNAELASQSGAIRALIRGLLKCSASRISESVTLTLSHLLNKPETRAFIRSQIDIETLLAPITDLHYRHLIEENRSSHTKDNSHRVEASKMTIVALLKTWPGIFSLGNPGNTGLQPLLSMLPLATPDVQKEILDVLYSVFQLKVPDWTDCFSDAVTSVDPAQPKNEWSLSEGFVAAEGKDLLPPKTVDRTDLVTCYQALLLATLLEIGLFDNLVEVCLKAERHVAVMATILLAQLLHLSNTILPPGYSSDVHSLPDLIGSAIDFVEEQDQRHRASEVISCLDRVHQLKKERVKPSSLYLKLILEQSGYFSDKKKGETEQQHNTSDLDEATLNSLIKDTNVLNTKTHTSWNWSLLHSLLQHPSLKPSHMHEDSMFARLVKRLSHFYMPSKHLYSCINYSESNAKKFSAVGQELVKYLCRVEDSSSGFLFDLVSDIVEELSQVTASKLTADVFSSSNVSHKISRDYFLLLGTISFHKPSLLRQCKAYGALVDICNYPNRSDLMRLMITTLDFAHDNYSRVILNKVLTATEREMRHYATKHMRVLLRAKMPFFNSWGLELMLSQLYDVDRQVAMEAVDILDEACEEENFLEALVLQQPQLLHLGEKGAALLTRFFSVKRGFNLMSRMGYLEFTLNDWFREYNLLYVYIVEERLAETLTSFKQTEEGEFVRRNNTAVIFPKAFVPVHLYGQLVQHEEGCISISKEHHVSRFAQTIRDEMEENSSPDNVVLKKAAIWALGHIGSSPGGLQLLLEEEVIEDLVDLAETCPVLSIRGTCFYALCLISKTPQGANILLEANWTAVRHSLEEKWPLAIDPDLKFVDEPGFTPVMKHTLPPYDNAPNRMVSYKDSSEKATTLPGRVAALGEETSNEKTLKFNIKDHKSHKLRRSDHLLLRKSASTTTETILRGNDLVYRQKGSLKRQSRRQMASGSMIKRGHKKSLLMNGQIVRRRPRSLNVEQMLEAPDDKRIPLTPGLLGRSLSNTNINVKPFLGVCLPIDISRLFEYEEPVYEGCITKVISAPLFTNHDHIPPHDPYHCLECSIPLIKPYHGIGMSISSDSLSSHFLYAPPTFPGGDSPSTPRSRAHTLDNNLLTTTNKLKDHHRSASATLPTNSNVADGDSDPSKCRTPIAVETSENGDQGQHVGSQARYKLANKSPSPLVRMKKIHDSQEEEEMRGKSLLETAVTPKQNSALRAESQAGTLKDPEVLVQIVKPSLSKASQKTSQKPPSPTATETSGNSSSQSQGMVDEASPEGRSRLQHAVLEVVYGLSSDVSHRKNLTGLNMICHRFPSVCQDVCLYSQIMDLLSSYHYNLQTRRLIESKFDKLSFDPLFAAKPQLDEEFSEDDFISSNSSSRRTSFSSLEANSSQTSLTIADQDRPIMSHSRLFSRRSSASESSRFREKLHSLSRSAEMHEPMMVELPRESEDSQTILSEQYNTNGNNNSPKVDRVDGLISPPGSNHPPNLGAGATQSSGRTGTDKPHINSTDSSFLDVNRENKRAKSFGETSCMSVIDTAYDL